MTIYRAGLTKRVIESSVPDLLYPAASEIEDFGAAQPSLDIGLDQISLVAGVGPPWRGHVTIR